MIRIESSEIGSVKEYFHEAAAIARLATCRRAKCGSVVVSRSGIILGTGFNAPPLGDETQRFCDAEFDNSKKPSYDTTCCVHAEWNAVMDAKRNVPADDIAGSRLYFMRVDENGDFTDAGEPYCTTCSRITMVAGVGEFALWNAGGADIYTLPEYNTKSYQYFSKQNA